MVVGSKIRILCVGLCLVASTIFCAAAEEPWIEVKSPNFIILSNGSQRQARRVAKQFEQFRYVLRTLLPKLKVDSGTPLTVFAVPNEKDFKALLPGDHIQKGAKEVSGFFQSGAEKNFVVLRTDAPPEWSYHTIYHEYVHMAMRLNFQGLPLWLTEGLAEFYGNAEIGDKESNLGKPSANMLHILAKSALIPIADFLAITQDSPYYREQQKANLFYAQSWALTHYLMIGDKRAHFGQMVELLNLLQAGVPEKGAAGRAFGDLRALEKNLASYVGSRSFYYQPVRVQLNVQEDQYAVRTLSAADSIGARGDLLAHVGRLEEARTMLEQALQLDPRSTLANEGLGLVHWRLRKLDEARKYFSAAVALDSRSYIARYFAAQLAYRQDSDFAAAEAHLRKAIDINPLYAPAYALLSYVLMLKPETLPEALEMSRMAVKLDPSNTENYLTVGRILIQMNRLDEAQSHAERLLAAARTQADREAADALLLIIKYRREDIPTQQASASRGKARSPNLEEGLEAERKLQASRELSRIPKGSAGKLAGRILSARCDYPATLEIGLDANGKQQTLHAENYFNVEFWATGDSIGKNLDPCKDLEGKRAEIEYWSVTGQPFLGLIKSIALEK